MDGILHRILDRVLDRVLDPRPKIVMVSVRKDSCNIYTQFEIHDTSSKGPPGAAAHLGVDGHT